MSDTALTDSTTPKALPASRISPSSGSSTKTTSPSWSWAKSVIPIVTISSSTKTHSCSSVYFSSSGKSITASFFFLKSPGSGSIEQYIHHDGKYPPAVAAYSIRQTADQPVQQQSAACGYQLPAVGHCRRLPWQPVPGQSPALNSGTWFRWSHSRPAFPHRRPDSFHAGPRNRKVSSQSAYVSNP